MKVARAWKPRPASMFHARSMAFAAAKEILSKTKRLMAIIVSSAAYFSNVAVISVLPRSPGALFEALFASLKDYQ